ncbi:hypothetical protein D3C76_1081780 [compost metagenome]
MDNLATLQHRKGRRGRADINQRQYLRTNIAGQLRDKQCASALQGVSFDIHHPGNKPCQCQHSLTLLYDLLATSSE